MKKIYASFLTLSLMASPSLAGEYDASKEFPFGRANPAAGAQIKDFDFAIGKWQCLSQTPDGEGGFSEVPLNWQFNYILNGRGVQDYFASSEIEGMGIRQINPEDGLWYVAYHAVWPNYSNAMWSGQKVGNDMVLNRMLPQADGSEVNMRLSFYDIKPDHFKWRGEFVGKETTLFWRIICDTHVVH